MRLGSYLSLPVIAFAAWTCSVANAPDDPVAPGEGGAGPTTTSSNSGGNTSANGGGGNAPGCGDGMIGAGETCDPPSSCPADCDDMDACTADTLMGSANACNVECSNTPITTCEATGDGCCPGGCSGTTDLDCAMCGNSVVDLGETCDGTCPADCDDMDGCTIDSQVGSPTTCDIDCSYQTITVCQNNDGCCAQGCTLSNDNDCQPIVVTRPAIHRGWWNSTGSHDSTNDNTLTGESGGNYNSYFIFDLTGITGTVQSVTLRLEIEAYTSSDPSETLQIWDVTTNTVTLEASGTNIGIFNDLQSGTLYNTFNVTLSDVTQIKATALNSTGVLRVQAALGSQFAVGLHVAAAAAGQWVRFSGSSEPRIHELVVTYF